MYLRDHLLICVSCGYPSGKTTVRHGKKRWNMGGIPFGESYVMLRDARIQKFCIYTRAIGPFPPRSIEYVTSVPLFPWKQRNVFALTA